MRLARLAPLLMVVAACGPGSHAPPDGGPPLALDVLDSAQIGLHYGKSTQLRVRYHTDDPAAVAVAGAAVRFSIFNGNPAGSTLSRDQVITGADGVATVTLTAGQAEATFKVAAAAPNALEADFDVSISKFDFVEIGAELAWPTAVTLRALLYDDRSCAALPPAPTQPPPARALAKSNATTATLQFVNLLSMTYALVGRAESADGHVVGYGCVDLGAELVPPGSVSVVPLPLAAAVPSVVGKFTLTSTLVPLGMVTQPLLTPWQTLGDCSYGAAQMLLDAMAVETGASHPHRDLPGTNGCRPPSTTSLDQQLQALLTAPPTAPANLLAAVADDLEGIVAAVTLQSTLTVSSVGPGLFGAEHALSTATFARAPQTRSYDLVQLGKPIVDVKDVPLTNDGGTVTIGAHRFTFGWTTLWLQAFTDLSLTQRVSGLGSPAIPSLVAALVAPAARNGKTGCGAVDDLVCTVTTGAGSCALATPCASALRPWAATLAAGFAPASGYDLTLGGSAKPVDPSGSLVADQLAAGTWSAPGLALTSSFSGQRQ